MSWPPTAGPIILKALYRDIIKITIHIALDVDLTALS